MFFKKFKPIDIHKAKELVERGEAILIDVRKSEDFHASHINGAILLDKDSIDGFIKEVDKSKPIICYCYVGKSSCSFCKDLVKAGFSNVYNLKGGFEAWKKINPIR